MNTKPKIDHPTLEQWEKRVEQIIMANAPTIIECKHCKWPVEEGFCCPACGSTRPR